MNRRSTIKFFPLATSTVALRATSILALLCFGSQVSGQNVSLPTSAPARQDAVVTLPTFEVTTGQDAGYVSTHSTGASRLNVDLRDTPMSVVVLNEQFLADVGAVNFMDAFQYVSNMAANETGLNEIYSLRGVVVQGTQRDGLPEPGGPALGVNNSVIDPAFFSRVEVIKGPAGTIYGSHDLGGVVNRVSKVASFEKRFGSIQATAGSFDMQRLVFDYNTPFADARGAVRVTALYQDAETIPGDNDNRRAVQLNLSTKLHNGGKLWFTPYYGENETMTGTAPWFIDAVGNISTSFDRRFSYNQNDAKNKDSRTFGEIGYQQPVSFLGTTWNVRLVGRYSQLKFADRLYNPRTITFFNSAGTAIAGGNLQSAWSDVRITSWTVRDQNESLKYNGGFLDVAGEIETGPVKHIILTYLQQQHRDKYTRRITNNWKAMSYLFPVYEANPQQFRTNAVDALAVDVTTIQNSSAWGFQDNLSLFNGRLNVVLGTRYDSIKDDQADRRNNVFFNDRKNTNWLFNYGATFDLTKDITLYAQHGETYQARGGLDGLGNAVPNEQGEVNEAGFKIAALEGRLSVTAAYFKMKQTNILELTFVPSLNVALPLPAGNVTVEGWETDIRYQPVKGLNVLAAAGNLNSKTSVGTLPRNVPQGLNYQLFVKYDFQRGPLKGFGVGSGYTFTSKRAVEGNPKLLLPGNHEWNGVATYTRGDWKFHLALTNIDDNRAAKSSALNARIMPVPPRSFRVSATYSF